MSYAGVLPKPTGGSENIEIWGTPGLCENLYVFINNKI